MSKVEKIQKILEYLEENGAASKKDIIKSLEIKKGDIKDILKEMKERGWIFAASKDSPIVLVNGEACGQLKWINSFNYKKHQLKIDWKDSNGRDDTCNFCVGQVVYDNEKEEFSFLGETDDDGSIMTINVSSISDMTETDKKNTVYGSKRYSDILIVLTQNGLISDGNRNDS